MVIIQTGRLLLCVVEASLQTVEILMPAPANHNLFARCLAPKNLILCQFAKNNARIFGVLDFLFMSESVNSLR